MVKGRSSKMPKQKVVTVRLPPAIVYFIDYLVLKRLYSDRNEFIRYAVTKLVREEIKEVRNEEEKEQA